MFAVFAWLVQSTVTLDGQHYGTSNWHKSKKLAEHAAAVVAVVVRQLPITLDDGLLERPLPAPWKLPVASVAATDDAAPAPPAAVAVASA